MSITTKSKQYRHTIAYQAGRGLTRDDCDLRFFTPLLSTAEYQQ